MNRRKRMEYAEALASMKQWAGEDRPKGWTAEEWGNFVGRVSSQKPPAPESSRFPLLRPLISVAAALIVLVWAEVFLLKIPPADISARKAAGPAEIASPAVEEFRPLPEIVLTEPARRAESALSRPAASEPRVLAASAARMPRPSMDKPAFTWISSETGLKIVWFTNNNLKLEDLP